MAGLGFEGHVLSQVGLVGVPDDINVLDVSEYILSMIKGNCYVKHIYGDGSRAFTAFEETKEGQRNL